jgi:hypothetical protein
MTVVSKTTVPADNTKVASKATMLRTKKKSY